MKTRNPSTVTSALRGRATQLAVLAGIAVPMAMQASTDYGPAIWKWAACNYSTSGYGHSFVVIHDMEGYYASSMSYLSKCSTSASIHYGVNGKKDNTSDYPAGEIAQSVRESYYAWHALCWNHYMWGTEHEGFISNPAWYTDAMYNATIGLQTHLMNKNGKPKDRNHVIGHNQKTYSGWNSWVNANYAFSPTCNSHSDPGPYWNWTRLMNGIKGVASTPSAPSGLAVAVVSSSSLKVTWKDNSTIETGYKVERSLSSGSGFSQIGTTGANGTALTSTGLSSGTRYYFRVRAYNAAGNSGYSNTGSAVTKDTIPVAPASLTATATSNSQINLAWTCSAGNEDGFKIYRSTDGTTFAQIATAGINATSFSNTGLSANVKYYYRVYSYNTAGNSAASNTASDTTAPQAPSGLTAGSAGTGPTLWDKINLSWTDNANSEVGFKIERGTALAGPFTQIATNAASDTTFIDSGRAAQTTYYYRVRTYNANGNSSYSNVASATTPNAPPVLTAIGAKTVAANAALSFTVSATDANPPGTAQTLWQDFQSFPGGTPVNTILFNKPASSSTTSAFIDTTVTNFTQAVANGPATWGSGNICMKATWAFKTGTTNPWVRLVTSGIATNPNPTIALDQKVQFLVYSTKAISLGIGVRETGTAAAYGANGGTNGTIEWVGVTNVVGGQPIPDKLIAASTSTLVEWNIPFSAQAAFTGDGNVDQSGAKGVLEQLVIRGEGGTGTYAVWFDAFKVVTGANSLAYSLDAGAPAGATIGRRNGKFSWTPTSGQVGLWNITVRVTDALGGQDFETIKVTVTGTGNNAPVLAAIGSKTVKEGTALAFTATATDVDAGQTKTFSLDAGAPSGASINGSTGAFTWTPTEAQGAGSYPITVRVTDNGSPASNDFETITVTVSEVNTAPVLATIPPQSVTEGSVLTVNASATDADLPANTLTYSLETGAPAGMTINSSTGVITWTPGESDGPDTTQVTVKVTDNGSPILSSKQTFDITINEGNVAPVLTLGTTMSTITPIDDFEEQDVEAASGSVLFRPPVYSSTTVGFLDASPNMTEILNQTNPYPDVDVNTSAQVLHANWSFKTGTTNPWVRLTTYTTTEYTNLYADPNPTVDFSQRVSVKIWSDKSIKICLGVRETGTTTPIGFDGGVTGTIEYVGVSGKQANGCPIPTHTVTASNWTTVEFDLPTEGKAAFTGDGVLTGSKGTLENISIIPNGGMGVYNVYFDDLTAVSVSTNLAIDTGATITVNCSATDSDVPAQGLTFSLGAGAPTNAVIDDITGVFTWTPNPDQSPSTNAIPIVVTDDGSPALSDTKNLVVVVRKVNTPPRLGGVPDQAVEISTGDVIAFTATGEDDDVPADTLTFSMTGAPTGATLNSSTGDFSWTSTGSSTNTFSIRVTDNGSPAQWDEKTITIRVTPANTAPMISLSAATVTEAFATFETFTNGTPNEYVMFNKPLNSSTTTNYIDSTATNYTTVVTSFPAGNPSGSAKVMKVGWSFKTGQTDQWVRLNTFNATTLPNPTIDLRHSLKFDIYTTKSIKLGVGVRETGTTAAIGANGGTTGSIEYVGCSTKVGTTPIPTRTIPSNTWTTVVFNLPTEPLQTLTGDSILAAAEGTLEHLILYGNGGSGAYTVYVDSFQVVYNYSLGSQINMNTGATLAFTASGTDPDPGAGLGFGLGADDPATAVLDPTTGAFTWTPDATFAGTTNSFTVTVEDSPTNGGIPKSGSQSFNVAVVSDPVGPLSAAADSSSVNWDSVAGKTYQVQSRNSDGSWSDVGAPVTATDSSSSVSLSSSAEYRVLEIADAGAAE